MNQKTPYEIVTGLIAKNPLCIPEIIRAVNEGFEAFVAKQKAERDRLADGSIRTLIWMADTGGKPFEFLIDVAFHQFPTGPTNHCQAEMTFWDDFLESASKKVDVGWLRSTRGVECLAWYARYVVPAVRARIADRGELATPD